MKLLCFLIICALGEWKPMASGTMSVLLPLCGWHVSALPCPLRRHCFHMHRWPPSASITPLCRGLPSLQECTWSMHWAGWEGWGGWRLLPWYERWKLGVNTPAFLPLGCANSNTALHGLSETAVGQVPVAHHGSLLSPALDWFLTVLSYLTPSFLTQSFLELPFKQTYS
jgi:hypothetical protein